MSCKCSGDTYYDQVSGQFHSAVGGELLAGNPNIDIVGDVSLVGGHVDIVGALVYADDLAMRQARAFRKRLWPKR